MREINKNIEFLLNDKRNCRSDNLKKFFQYSNNAIFFTSVIRCDGKLWFAYLGDMPNYWIGAKVVSVACYGSKEKGGEYLGLRGKAVEDVTEWFWAKYKERGIISIPEVWHRKIPRQLTHKELHTT